MVGSLVASCLNPCVVMWKLNHLLAHIFHAHQGEATLGNRTFWGLLGEFGKCKSTVLFVKHIIFYAIRLFKPSPTKRHAFPSCTMPSCKGEKHKFTAPLSVPLVLLALFVDHRLAHLVHHVFHLSVHPSLPSHLLLPLLLQPLRSNFPS